jgi:hypothetical protein
VSGTATLVAWLALVVAGAAAAAEPEGGGHRAFTACVAVAGPVALVAAIRSLGAIRGGPRVISFERREALLCDAAQADVIRGAAQLRGTMGGAGHLYPARLAFQAAAWLAAVVAGAEALSARAAGTLGPWPATLATAAAVAALLFPPRPFWYREVTGGGVVVNPPSAAAALLARDARGADARSVEPAQGP